MNKSFSSESFKKRGLFICFTGIDGSGKTTLSNSLVEILMNKGFKTYYVYNRYIPIILRPFIYAGEKLFLRKNNFFTNYNSYSEKKKKETKKHPFLSNIYQTIIIIDYFFQIIFKIKIPLMFGRSIICDRYIYDTIVTDLSVDFNYSEDKIKRTSEQMQKYFPRPDFIFFVDVPEEIAFNRKDDVPSIEYLKDRRHLYTKVANLFNMNKLDGTKRIDQLLIDIDDVIRG